MAIAQDAATNGSPKPFAVTRGDAPSKTSAAPVPGANSFTRKQARRRLEDHGYSDVKGLKLDNQGIWHGTAVKGGKAFDVAIDYQGNITAE